MYMEITVTNVIKKAGVARASFYRNFNSISDVIDALVDGLSDDLIENVFSNLSGTDERKLREFFVQSLLSVFKKEMEEDRFENLPVLFSRLDTKKDHWASGLPLIR